MIPHRANISQASEPRHAISWDDSAAPLVYYRFEGLATDQDVERYLAHLDQTFARGPVAMLFDARRIGMQPPALLRRQGYWLKANQDRVRERALGSVFVFDNPAVSFMMTAIFVVAPIPHDYQCVASLRHAAPALDRYLSQHGVTPPMPVAQWVHAVAS